MKLVFYSIKYSYSVEFEIIVSFINYIQAQVVAKENKKGIFFSLFSFYVFTLVRQYNGYCTINKITMFYNGLEKATAPANTRLSL